MRVHGISIDREPYLFKQLDPAVYRSMLNAVQLRYRLLPYIQRGAVVRARRRHHSNGAGAAYEKGQSARYELAWNDATRTLRIGARQGAFPGMVRQRMLHISVAGAGAITRTVKYTGRPLTVRFGS